MHALSRDWYRFLNSEIYIVCNSKEEIKSFLAFCDSQGVEWYAGGEKVLASKNRTFNRYSRAPVYFEYTVGHIWSIVEFIRELSHKEIVPFSQEAQ